MIVLSSLLSLFVSAALAYDTEHITNYSDAPTDLQTAISVSTLTEKGIVQGHPDGTFKAEDLVNRAEFVHIVMGLVPHIEIGLIDDCFPDVSLQSWFGESVCLAKFQGFIHGNAREGVDLQYWFFEPSRPVQYEEAVKVLIEIYAVPLQSAIYILPDPPPEQHWYDDYLWTARQLGVDLPRMRAGQKLTRGEMSRLVVNFIAYSTGTLDDLRRAEEGLPPEDDIPQEDDPIPVQTEDSADDVVETEEEVIEEEPAVYDPNPDDSTSSAYLLLGSTSPVLGAARVFSDDEPLQVSKILIELTSSSVSSIDGFQVYYHDGKFLGRAYKDSSLGPKHYSLPLSSDALQLEKREDYSFYVRADIKPYNRGGKSGEIIQIDSLGVQGDGVWSSKEYTKLTSSTTTFNEFLTSRAAITSIDNPVSSTDVLVSGNDIPLGSLRFTGETGDGGALLELTSVDFNVGTNGDVTIANVTLGADRTNDRHTCSFGSGVATCSSIPAQLGSFEGSPRVLTLYGDVTVADDDDNAWLRLQISNGGTTSSAGDITWTDGEAIHTWVPGGRPLASSTHYSR